MVLFLYPWEVVVHVVYLRNRIKETDPELCKHRVALFFVAGLCH